MIKIDATREQKFVAKQSTGYFAIGVWTPLATKGVVQPPLETPAILCPRQAAGNIGFNLK